MKFSLRSSVLVSLLGAACASATQSTTPESRAEPAPALAVAPLSGQRIPVLPATYFVADPDLDSMLPADRMARLHWADSLLADALVVRGPEVIWVLPAELRKVAARAPNMVTDPDRMGQAVLRSSKVERVPDPLRGYMRSLTALTNSRLVFVPAAIRVSADTTTGDVRAELVLVVADSRNGNIVWRSSPNAVAKTPAAALESAIAHILPDFQ